MSRTIRRTQGHDWSWDNGRQWKYNTDSSWFKNYYSQMVKYHTNRRRRSDEREMIDHLKDDPEDDFYDRKKWYMGIIWFYD